jgi:hypothetical protein
LELKAGDMACLPSRTRTRAIGSLLLCANRRSQRTVSPTRIAMAIGRSSGAVNEAFARGSGANASVAQTGCSSVSGCLGGAVTYCGSCGSAWLRRAQRR